MNNFLQKRLLLSLCLLSTLPLVAATPIKALYSGTDIESKKTFIVPEEDYKKYAITGTQNMLPLDATQSKNGGVALTAYSKINSSVVALASSILTLVRIPEAFFTADFGGTIDLLSPDKSLNLRISRVGYLDRSQVFKDMKTALAKEKLDKKKAAKTLSLIDLGPKAFALYYKNELNDKKEKISTFFALVPQDNRRSMVSFSLSGPEIKVANSIGLVGLFMRDHRCLPEGMDVKDFNPEIEKYKNSFKN